MYFCNYEMVFIIMKVRLTTNEDYKELCDWWSWHRFPAPSLELLDNLRFGIMVSYQGENICAGFVYFTNARAYGMLEFVVSTYKVRDKEIRTKAIRLLLFSLQELAKKQGVKMLFSSLRNANLIKHYKDCGFVQGSTNTTEMICVVK